MNKSISVSIGEIAKYAKNHNLDVVRFHDYIVKQIKEEKSFY